MTQKINPAEWIRRAPVGTMVYEMRATSLDEPFRMGFLVREDAERVKAFGVNPIVEMRCGSFEYDDVLLIAVLFKIGDELYETWINYYQTGGGEKYLRDLAEQDQITIMFFTPEPSKMVGITNRNKEFFAGAMERAKSKNAWTMQQFDAAREKVYARHTTVAKLWKEFRGKSK